MCRYNAITSSNFYFSEYTLYFAYVWDTHRADIEIVMLPYLHCRNVDQCSGLSLSDTADYAGGDATAAAVYAAKFRAFAL